MSPENESLETLQEIRSIMDRSSRFLSLSGWSGIWAGCTAIAGGAVAYDWLVTMRGVADTTRYNVPIGDDFLTLRFFLLAIVTLIVAVGGGIFFTIRKTRQRGSTVWNSVTRQICFQMLVPLGAGGIFALAFLRVGDTAYIAPVCLVFYGLALIGASKYTISDIRYLGMLEVALGCANIFLPGHGLYFWMGGFGVLHILYGAIMWKKYDRGVVSDKL